VSRPPVRRIPVPGLKDESGAYIKEPVDLSIDALLKQGLETIHGVMKVCRQAAKSGIHTREDVMNLKDCMAMLSDLKEKEDALLEEMSEEELKKVANADSVGRT
jgi:hypothetical protein